MAESSSNFVVKTAPEESKIMFPKDFAEEPSLPMPKKIELDDPNVENSNTNCG